MNKNRLHFVLRIAAVSGLIVLSAVSIVNYAQQTRAAWQSFTYFNSTDDVTRWENRVAGLKASIPFKEGTLGYISADPQNIEFTLTQYALTPLVLQRGPVSDWIVANYPGKPIQQVLQKQLDLQKYAVDNYGYGLYLVHKK